MSSASRLALLIVVTIAGGLLADSRAGAWGQPLVSLWVWTLVGWLLWRERELRPRLLACLLIATAGEVVLSLAWGLYDYRLGNLPLFVPPGHVLLYWLGLQLAERLPAWLLSWAPRLAVVAVSLLALAGLDWLGPLLLLLFLLCVWRGPAPRLYVTMFLLSLLMELWGTWLGCWNWRALAPGLGWPVSNPPLAAGAFYCVLDLLSDAVQPRRSLRTA
ncbi:hypothetical protein [Zoogloea sp.]|uniref:hypothetical protein n=1 Tax=Zoogloea sp. TaxID=49181 RepID=UPI0035B2A9B8